MPRPFNEEVASDIQNRMTLSERLQYGIFAGGIALGVCSGMFIEPGIKTVATNITSIAVLGIAAGVERKMALSKGNHYLFQYQQSKSNGTPASFEPLQVDTGPSLLTGLGPLASVMTGYLGEALVGRAMQIGPAVLEDRVYTGVGSTLLVASVAAIGCVHADARSAAAAFGPPLKEIG